MTARGGGVPTVEARHERTDSLGATSTDGMEETNDPDAFISVIVHDPFPDPIAPITEDEIREYLELLGYHVKAVLVRNDFPPPYWLVWRGDGGRHVGPFSTRLDACTALGLTNAKWELLSDDEFHQYLDTRGFR